MESIQVNGLVLRQVNYGEADRILTVFTKEEGIIPVMAKGVRKYKSHQRAAASLFCYGEFNLHPGKNMYSMRGSKLINSFYSISQSIQKLALASYICEITAYFVPEREKEEDVLSLVLNTLYILSEKERDLFLIKSVFELKLLSMVGYEIDTDRCILCGSENTVVFSPDKSGMLCTDCASSEPACPASAVQALKYILKNDTKNIFSFSLDEAGLKSLSTLSERFVLKISERNFSTLAYFYSITD